MNADRTMSRRAYHFNRRRIHEIRTETRRLCASTAIGYHWLTAQRESARAAAAIATLRSEITAPIDLQAANQNDRLVKLHGALQDAARDKRHRDHCKRELALLEAMTATCNVHRIERALARNAITFGGATAAQAFASMRIAA
jgi:hypothetical protein